MPVKKIIIGGDKDFPYNLPENSAIEQFIIKVYNETSKQLSYYTFKKTEGCFKTIESEDSPLIMTIYGCNANNEVLNEDYYQIPSSGQAEKQTKEPHSEGLEVATIQCEVKEKVSSPNISHPLIILRDPPENNTDPNSYLLIVKDRKTKTKFINITTSVDQEITDPSIILTSRSNYDCELYKVEKNGNKFSVTGSLSVKKIIIGGDKDFPYNLPENSAIEQFIIKVYNETSKQLSYYTFKKTEGCFKTIESEDSPLIMTIYGCNANNEVLNEDYYQIPSSGQAEKQSREPYYEGLEVATIKCDLKEKVSSPNISHPLIILRDPPENNTDPNSYLLIVKDRKTKTKFINITTSVDQEITDPSIILTSRSNYDCELYKVEKIGNKFSVTGSLSVRKIIIGGDKDFPYNLPENSAIEQFIIKVYNKTSKQLSYYTFKKTEGCFKTIESEDSPLTMTIYGCNANNEVLNEDYYQIPSSGQAEKQSYAPYYMEPRVATIQCEVKEKVPSPNISHPLFILRDPPENNTDPNSYVLIVKDRKTDTKFINITTSVDQEITDPSIILTSRSNYDCTLHKVEKNGNKFSVKGSSLYNNLKSRNSMEDAEKLKNKAVSYIEGRIECEVKHLYRNKPNSHSTIIESKSTGILKKYMKDNNGDPFSSINRNICGLHFSATPGTSSGDLSSNSYFGDYRIMVPPQYLVEGNNLYFTDFFCMRRIHWVTLVLTKPGSDEDKFCQNRLVKLDIQNNPFFYKSGNGYKVTSVEVEILYTEDINLTEMRQKVGFQETTSNFRGKGGSKSDGVPKNSSCTICNL